MAVYQKKTNNPKMGRPKIEISDKDFKKLCGMHCTKAEIAGFFECSEDTIEKYCKRQYNETFTATYKKFSPAGNISLRRYQFKLAETNTTMAIWLGKQWLGQREPDREDLGALDNDVKVEINLVDTSGESNEN